MVAAGHNYSCAVLTSGAVKCWGENYVGQLGLGNTATYGNTSSTIGSGLPTVDIGQTVKYIAAGEHNTTCAIRADDETVCWGRGYGYLLGTGVWNTIIGDQSGEMGSALTPVDFGSSYAVTLSEGDDHICALLASGAVKCWGQNSEGQLGINGTDNFGDSSELGANWPAVDLYGNTAVAVSAGAFHTCAILSSGDVTCWGLNNYGQLGYGDTTNRGSADLGSALETVNLGYGKTATAIAAGGYFTCAILNDGTLKCWGYNASGQLGQDSTTTLGDGGNEMGDYLLPIDLGDGRTAKNVYASRRADLDYTCAILDNDSLKCWGQNDNGQLGLGDSSNRGDATGEMATLGTVNLGSGQTAAQVAMGEIHTCVLLTSTDIKCFGKGSAGQLGNGTGGSYGDTGTTIGDKLPIVNLGVVY
jgi:alpha-tubulin suppressor-like RCC1 family protein